MLDEDDNFVGKLVFSDEATFHSLKVFTSFVKILYLLWLYYLDVNHEWTKRLYENVIRLFLKDATDDSMTFSS
jgi:hypothetical protein